MKVIRSRNKKDFEGIVADVGGSFDGDMNFDHHQKTLNKEVANQFDWQQTWGGEIPQAITIHNGLFHADDIMVVSMLELLSTTDKFNFSVVEEVDGGIHFEHNPASAGLVLKKLEVEEILPQKLSCHLYDRIIKGVDARDNGIDIEKEGVYSLSSIASQFCPNWDSNKTFDTAFEEAVEEVKSILKREVESFLSKERAAAMVKAKIAVAKENNNSFIFMEQFVPWKETVIKEDEEEDILFAVYPSSSEGWCVVSTPPSLNDMTNQRKSFPSSWVEEGNEFVNSLMGVDDTIFIHGSNFMGVWKSRESAMKVARNLAASNPIEI